MSLRKALVDDVEEGAGDVGLHHLREGRIEPGDATFAAPPPRRPHLVVWPGSDNGPTCNIASSDASRNQGRRASQDDWFWVKWTESIFLCLPFYGLCTYSDAYNAYSRWIRLASFERENCKLLKFLKQPCCWSALVGNSSATFARTKCERLCSANREQVRQFTSTTQLCVTTLGGNSSSDFLLKAYSLTIKFYFLNIWIFVLKIAKTAPA